MPFLDVFSVSPPPPELALLHDFQRSVADGAYSGWFFLDDDGADARHSLLGPKAVGQVDIFGGGDDGHYALWYDDGAIRVGFLDYPDGHVVLASSVREFVELLLLGVEDLPRRAWPGEDWVDEAVASMEPAPHLDAFRAWAADSLGLSVPDGERARGIIDRADAHYAAFQAVVRVLH